MPKNYRFLLAAFFVVVFWISSVILVAHFTAENYHEHTLELAKNMAKTITNKDWAFRSWVNRHGGVYVKISEIGEPNPHLSHLPDRDIFNENGVNLTLMSPAQVLKQTMEHYSEMYGIKGRIVGLNPLNPINKAIGWELEALRILKENPEKEYLFNFGDRNDTVFCSMKPLIADANCLRCHTDKSFKIGSLVGGVGIKLSLDKLLNNEKEMVRHLYDSMVSVWVLGIVLIMLLIGWIGSKISQNEQFQDSLNSDRKAYQIIIDSIDMPVYVSDMETYELIAVNEFCKKTFGEPGKRKCYEYFQGVTSGKPCEFCTNDRLIGNDGEVNGVIEWELLNPLTERWYACRDKAIKWIDGRVVRLEIATDITDIKENEKCREGLIIQLGEAFEQIKKLQGILPICSYCKKIRNDAGAWSQMEEYISKHSEAKFSHGICPECFEKIKKDFE